jgi:tRNA(fMet)-specific endonuclease VapC
LAVINRQGNVRRQVPAYLRLIKLFEVLTRWEILEFDDSAADEFIRLRKERVRIGTLDLKISAIALVNGARLLSGNLRDFEQVPGLQVENWLR